MSNLKIDPEDQMIILRIKNSVTPLTQVRNLNF
ncbi:MAG: hypothetical protein ACI8ZM_000922 [Crocinitomix sp.]|jgi:hypothetical protein